MSEGERHEVDPMDLFLNPGRSLTSIPREPRYDDQQRHGQKCIRCLEVFTSDADKEDAPVNMTPVVGEGESYKVCRKRVECVTRVVEARDDSNS